MICSKCDEEKPASEFYGRRDRNGQLYASCKQCQYGYQKDKRESRRAAIIAEHGGACEKCGYDRCSRALSFHHKDPSKKKFKLGSANLNRYSMEEVIAEAAKCVLLCANCHMETHSGLAQR